MKKIIAIIVAAIMFIPSVMAYYEWTERVDILSVDIQNDNLVVQLKDDETKWLIHYNGNCDSIANSSTATLSIRSKLDASGDYLKVSSYIKCKIDQAEIITGTLHVDDTYTSKTNAIVTDEFGKKYEIYYSSLCRAMAGYQGKEVYYYRYGPSLSQYDDLYLPDNGNSCQITYVDLIEGYKDQGEKGGDISVPTTVTNVKAVPSDGSIFLTWNEANDNVEIDHYVVSYHTYGVAYEDAKFEEMPNKVEVKDNYYEITDLDNGDMYYFYVIAVDAAGNISSDWSSEVMATPNSSIRTTDIDAKKTDVNLRKTEDTAYSFLIEWDKISSYNRQTIIFEINGKREFVYYNWWKNYMRISKKAARKGKGLKLIVKEYDIKGNLFQDEIEFNF